MGCPQGVTLQWYRFRTVASPRTSPRAGSRSKSRTATRAGTRHPRPSARQAAPKGFLAETRQFLGEHLGNQSDDVWGITLIVIGTLCGLGLAFDATGLFGRLVRFFTGALLGGARFAVPITLLALGWVMVRGRPREKPIRILIGAVFCTVALAGLLHLAYGAPRWGTPIGTLRHKGGLIGAAIAEPLKAATATWGAGLLLTTIGLLGVLILTGTRVRHALDRGAKGVEPAKRAARRGFDSLWTLGSDPVLESEAARRHRTAQPVNDRRLRSRPRAVYDGVKEGFGAFDDESLLPVEEYIPAREQRPDNEKRAEAAPRRPVEVTMPPEPDWKDEQPTVQDVPIPGIQRSVRGDEQPDPLDPAVVPKIVWKLPPRALLKKGKALQIDKREVESAGRTLEEALAAHGVETRLMGMTVGPTVTRFELELGAGVKVAKVTALHKDIAYAMASADVRILAPIPGKSAIGVEVPNRTRQLVAVGDILFTPEAEKHTTPLSVAIGRDIDGKPVMIDLAKMPHVLVAGTTGSGKSSCINSLLTSILMRQTPEDVRLILIDPKMVELSQYNGLPHLLTQVVINPKKAANALQWAVEEMERRYELLAQLGFRDLGGYNAAVEKGELSDPYADDPAHGLGAPPAPIYQKLSAILIVVDELADLMMVAARDVEESICRIAQKARAVGIHLVIATQRPSVNVITGLIKANVPSRFAFAVSSLVDSRVILDQPGAERLIGQGDMLMLTVSSNVAQRVQGNFVSEEEVRAVVGFWRRQVGAPTYVDGLSDDAVAPGGAMGVAGASDGSDDDDLLDQAMELVVRSQLGSTSMLQRKLRVGFARAGRLMDLLERKGIVGPSEGSKARAVMMTPEELDDYQKRKATV